MVVVKRMSKVTCLETVYTVKAIAKGLSYGGYIEAGKVYLPIDYVGKRVLFFPVILKSDLPIGILQKVVSNQWNVWIRKHLETKNEVKIRANDDYLQKLYKKYEHLTTDTESDTDTKTASAVQKMIQQVEKEKLKSDSNDEVLKNDTI